MELPERSVDPAELIETWLPKAVAEADLPGDAGASELALGLRLEGEGGGDWQLRLEGKRLQVERAPADQALFALVLSVEDWRATVWEGRGGAFGERLAALFRPGEARAQPRSRPPSRSQLEAIRGMLRLATRDESGSLWHVDVKVGPGPIPGEPTTTVTVSEEDAQRMQRGELDPMTAFMSGRVQVDGDMTLLMQLQGLAG